MSLRVRLVHWARALFRRRRVDQELREELSFHLEEQAKQLEAVGLSPAEAYRQARLRLGSAAAIRDEAGDARGGSWLDDARRDLTQALRQFRRAPSFAAITVLTIGLGTGATTAIMTVINAVLIRPSPLADQSRLAVVWQTDRRTGTTREPMSWPDFRDFRERLQGLATLAAFTSTELSLVDGAGDPVRLTTVLTTPNYFELVGQTPLLGRVYSADDSPAGPPRVALISEGLWRRRFAADSGIIGRTLRLDDGAAIVVGVLPTAADFGLDQINARAAYHPTYSGLGNVDVWAPVEGTARDLPRDTHPILVLARLASTTSFEVASKEAARIATDLESAFPQSNAQRGANLERLDDVVFGPVRPVLSLLIVAAFLVLAVGCVNATNLLLARGATRAREVAVRTALGASATRLSRQFAAESIVLAVVGAIAGILIAQLGLTLILRLAPGDLPRIDQIRLDGKVLTVSLLIAAVIGVGFGMVPTWQARSLDPIGVMRQESRSATAAHTGLRRGLVVFELALSVTLLVTATLLVRSFLSILGTGPGFDPKGLVKAQYQLPGSRYPRDFQRFPHWPEIQRFQTDLLDVARRLPGVTGAAIANAHPLDAGFTNSFTIVGREAEAASWPEISVRVVSVGYAATLGLTVREGRDLSQGDGSDAPAVALLNEAAAERFFPGASPLGRDIRFWGIPRRIVGVLSNERIHGLTEAVPPAVYVSLSQVPGGSGVLVLRTTGDPDALAGPVRDAFRRADPELAVYGIEPFTATVLGSVSTRRFAMLIIAVFAALTMTLALIGIHGLVSFLAKGRTREIGIRMALGATQRGVRGLVFKDGAAMVAAGVLLGLLGAGAGTRLVGNLLHGVNAADPGTYLLVGGVVTIAAFLAMWFPVRSASRADPTVALRADG